MHAAYDHNQLKSQLQLLQSEFQHSTTSQSESYAHNTQVEVGRYMSRSLISVVHIFEGCNDNFLDSLSILLHEVSIMPQLLVHSQMHVPHPAVSGQAASVFALFDYAQLAKTCHI